MTAEPAMLMSMSLWRTHKTNTLQLGSIRSPYKTNWWCFISSFDKSKHRMSTVLYESPLNFKLAHLEVLRIQERARWALGVHTRAYHGSDLLQFKGVHHNSSSTSLKVKLKDTRGIFYTIWHLKCSLSVITRAAPAPSDFVVIFCSDFEERRKSLQFLRKMASSSLCQSGLCFKMKTSVLLTNGIEMMDSNKSKHNESHLTVISFIISYTGDCRK